MIAAWLTGTAADNRLLGGRRLNGATPWVIAIMSFSMMIIAATGLALANAASGLSSSVEHRFTAQVAGGGAAGKALAEALRTAPGVTGIEAVPEAELRRTLQQWLGSAADSSELPVPALVHFDLAEGADPAKVEAHVRGTVPNAAVTAHSRSLRPLLGSLQALQWLALGLVLLLGIAASAAVVLAARAALDTHRATIEVMHGIGATDAQVTRLFQRKIALDALAGSVAGATAAALLLLVLFRGSRTIADLTGGIGLGTGHLVVLALLPLALTALATMVARLAVLAALRRSL